MGAQRLQDSMAHGKLYMQQNNQLTNIEVEKELQDKHRRSLSINLIRDIIHLHQKEINDFLEEPLLYTNYQICKLTNTNYKGIVVLLNMITIGVDANTRIEEYAKEVEIKEQELNKNESDIKKNT